MEVLYDVRPQHRLLTAILAVAAAACDGDIERADQPVDTAVVQSERLLDSAGTGLGIDPVEPVLTELPDSLLEVRRQVVLRADSAAGDLLFRGAGGCVACHGPRAEGVETLGPDLTDATWIHGDGSLLFIRRTIERGITRPVHASVPMPALGHALSPADAHRLAAYVFSLSHPFSVVDDTTDGELATERLADSAAGLLPGDSFIPPR